MTDLKRTRLVWSVVALVASCALGGLCYAFVAKHLIVTMEAQRLNAWIAEGATSGSRSAESVVVMTDGRIFGESASWSGEREPRKLLDRALASLDGSSVAGGWVYVAVPRTLEGGTTSGWTLGRASIVVAKREAALAVAAGSLLLWVMLIALFVLFNRSVNRAIARWTENARARWGLGADEASGDFLCVLERLDRDAEARSRDVRSRLAEQELLASVAKGTANGVFVCNAEGKVEWVNEALAKLLGCERHDLVGCSPIECLKTGFNDPFQLAALERALKAFEPVNLEVLMNCEGMEPIWASLELKPIRWADGQAKRFFGIVVDITEQRKASDKLEEISRRFTLAMESSNIGVWEWSVKRDHLVWDERMLALYGATRDAFGSTFNSWMDQVDPDYRNRTTRTFDQCLAKGENVELVARVCRKDGTEAYVKHVGRAFRNESGDVVRYLGIASDVTAQHLAERDLIEQKDEAESLAVRLAEAVKQSKKAAAEAYQATRAKSAFLAMMSHEIRTPMNGVIGMASLLLETELDEYQRDYLNTIRTSGDTLLTLINDILDYSKIESGKLDIERAPFSVRECVEEALDLLAAKAAEKNLELVCKIDLNMPGSVVGDITRLRQVLVNLVGNAVKFTEVGEVEVCVHPPVEGRLTFSVRDTGIGIPEDRMHRLFEVFSQVDSSTTRKYGGSGLGLSISKQLTELMGGEMWVESAVGKGSVFWFTIRFEASEKPGRDTAFDEQPSLVGRAALIVESNFVLRDYLRALVAAWGMKPIVMASREQLGKFDTDEQSYDAVIASEELFDAAYENAGEPFAAAVRQAKAVVCLQRHGSSIRRAEGVFYVYKPCRVSALLDAVVSGCVDPKAEANPVTNEKEDVLGAYAQRMPLRILVADDNSVNQKVARMMLKKFGYGCDLVANGVEAVEAVKQRDYDLIFMDCQMPEMDGFEATRMIRDLERDRSESRAAYIFALTANVREESHDRSKQVGMNGFLAKPIKLSDIKQALNEVASEMASRN